MVHKLNVLRIVEIVDFKKFFSLCYPFLVEGRIFCSQVDVEVRTLNQMRDDSIYLIILLSRHVDWPGDNQGGTSFVNQN